MQEAIARMVTLASLIPGAAEETLSLQERVTPFLLRGRNNTTVPIRLQEKTITLAPTNADGFIHQDIDGFPKWKPWSSAFPTVNLSLSAVCGQKTMCYLQRWRENTLNRSGTFLFTVQRPEPRRRHRIAFRESLQVYGTFSVIRTN